MSDDDKPRQPDWADDRAVGEWLMDTMRLFGCSEITAHKVTGLFLEAINAE